MPFREELPTPDFRLLFESAPGLYLVLTPSFRITAVSDAYLAATMTKREEILGRRLFEVFPDNPDDLSATGVSNLRSSLERVLRTKRSDTMAVQKYDVRRPGPSGEFEERYWSPVNSPVLDRNDQIVYILHRVEDVTDFVRTRAVDGDTSATAEELLIRAAAMGADVYRRAQEIQDANRELRGLQAVLAARIDARTSELQAANAELAREMAERQRTEAALRRTEEQFRQAQKMEAVGRLAGGVAHDFNNLLSVILIYGETLLKDVGHDEPTRASLVEILRAGTRAAELTKQLLAFSRQQVLEPRVLDLNHTVRALENMLRRVLGEDLEFSISTQRDLGRVRADPGQIDQVLMNLVVNARDAMPNGGRLTIETANVELAEAIARETLGLAPGPYVMLLVRDTGIGMDAATRARIFDPFFTTKERGKGTGLGLATVFGIVQQSGGAIGVHSEPGAGTTFRIYLPRVEGETGAPAPNPVEARGSVNSETVLLVEDEDPLRRLATLILERAGYQVLTAANGEAALRLCARYPGRINLLLTDVIMPGLNGREVADQVRALRPETRVVFMSGYTDDVILHHGVLGPDVAFLQKPLTTHALEAKVREVLDRTG